MTVFPTFIPGCEPRRRWQDDGDKVLCQDVLEQLLEEKVGELEDVQPQREFRYTSAGKPVRLDMYTQDKKRMYDAEMQNLNHQAGVEAGTAETEQILPVYDGYGSSE